MGILFMTSCEETYENTTAIIGKWKLVTADTIQIDEGFIWEFNEDETYTITNSQGRFEDDPFDSNPFREKGVFKEGYIVDAPKGVKIREEFRSKFFFSAVNINGDEMEMQFTPEDADTRPGADTKSIKLKFKKI